MPGQTTPRESNQLTLWAERGFSRDRIIPLMQRAVPRLAPITSPPLRMPGVPVVPLPSFADDYAAALEATNRLIAEHGIDILWVQGSAAYDLSPLDCTVHSAASPGVFALVDDKARFAEWLGDDPYRPDGVEVTGADAVAEEYYRRRGLGQEVCVKPAVGVFGAGYWRLRESPDAISMLNKPNAREIHPSAYLAQLRHEDSLQPTRLLVMDWLPGPEASVDLLCWRGEPLAHAVRTKTEVEDRQLLQSEHPVIDHARGIAKRLGLHGIIGMQYMRDKNGLWRMLEINPRPSGGSLHSEDVGFGLIANWARLIAGEIGPDEVKQHHGEYTLFFTYEKVFQVVPA